MLKQNYKQKVESLQIQVREAHRQGKIIQIAHGSTNSTRTQDENNNQYIVYTGDLTNVIDVDTVQRTITVESGMSNEMIFTYAKSYRLMPRVLAEFPGITAGGAVQGASLESSSWKWGQFNDSCVSYDVILGDGSFLKSVSCDNYSDLFYGISGSYGSLAIVTAVTIKCDIYKPYVKMEYIKIKTESLIDSMNSMMNTSIDFIEAIVFGNTSVIITGSHCSEYEQEIVSFSKPVDEWFYLHTEQVLEKKDSHVEYTQLYDYLFRYDRGAFWMGKWAIEWMWIPFSKRVRSMLDMFMHTRKLYDGLHAMNIMNQFFIQDAYVDDMGVQALLDFNSKELNIFPLWICPMKSTQANQYFSPQYSGTGGMLYDVGIYGKHNKKDAREINRAFEKLVHELDGRKMLYAENFYTESEFWDIYNIEKYDELRKTYRAETFTSMYEKISVFFSHI